LQGWKEAAHIFAAPSLEYWYVGDGESAEDFRADGKPVDCGE
jgi:hypothetical protein